MESSGYYSQSKINTMTIKKTKMLFALTISLMLLHQSCVKNTAPVKNDEIIDLQTYVAKTKTFIRSQATDARITAFSGIIDFSTTAYYEMYHSNETTRFYYSKLLNNGQQTGGLISLLLPNRRVFHYVAEVEVISTTTYDLQLYTLNGSYLGKASVVNGQITSTFNQNALVSDDEITALSRSWWGCTRECVSDAHIACFQDKTCMSLLLATNSASGFAVPKGLGSGSFSISIACGFVCLKNKDLDLLPQY
jgi:hypothetical protein